MLLLEIAAVLLALRIVFGFKQITAKWITFPLWFPFFFGACIAVVVLGMWCFVQIGTPFVAYLDHLADIDPDLDVAFQVAVGAVIGVVLGYWSKRRRKCKVAEKKE